MIGWEFLIFVGVLFLLSLSSNATCPNSSDKPWLTHHVSGSTEEYSAQAKRLSLGCTLESQFDAIVKGKVIRHRTWCCPPQNTSTLKRSALQSPDEIGTNADEDDGEPIVNVSVEDFVPWNLDRIDQTGLPLDGSYNPRAAAPLASQHWVHVYILDTGIDMNHVVFNNVTITLDYHSPQFTSTVDCNGHGTKVASILAGYTTGVVSTGTGNVESFARIHLHIVRGLGCSGQALSTDIIQTLNWIQLHGVRPSIVSMSLGSPKSLALNAMVESLIETGEFLVVVAGGNDNTDACTRSPSSAFGVKAVGATNTADQRASYSNYGPCLTAFAPGDFIYGAKLGSYNQITPGSGSSYACPIFVGSIVRYMISHPTVVNPFQAFNQVIKESIAGAVSNAGPGSPNKLVRIPKAGTPAPPSNNNIPPAQFPNIIPNFASPMRAQVSLGDNCIAYIIAIMIWFIPN